MSGNPFPEEAHLPIKEVYTPEDIDTIDVFWCRECCSLDVRRISITTNSSYCNRCGNTEIIQGSIDKWNMYKKYKNQI